MPGDLIFILQGAKLPFVLREMERVGEQQGEERGTTGESECESGWSGDGELLFAVIEPC